MDSLIILYFIVGLTLYTISLITAWRGKNIKFADLPVKEAFYLFLIFIEVVLFWPIISICECVSRLIHRRKKK